MHIEIPNWLTPCLNAIGVGHHKGPNPRDLIHPDRLDVSMFALREGQGYLVQEVANAVREGNPNHPLFSFNKNQADVLRGMYGAYQDGRVSMEDVATQGLRHGVWACFRVGLGQDNLTFSSVMHPFLAEGGLTPLARFVLSPQPYWREYHRELVEHLDVERFAEEIRTIPPSRCWFSIVRVDSLFHRDWLDIGKVAEDIPDVGELTPHLTDVLYPYFSFEIYRALLHAQEGPKLQELEAAFGWSSSEEILEAALRGSRPGALLPPGRKMIYGDGEQMYGIRPFEHDIHHMFQFARRPKILTDVGIQFARFLISEVDRSTTVSLSGFEVHCANADVRGRLASSLLDGHLAYGASELPLMAQNIGGQVGITDLSMRNDGSVKDPGGAYYLAEHLARRPEIWRQLGLAETELVDALVAYGNTNRSPDNVFPGNIFRGIVSAVLATRKRGLSEN